MVDLKTDLLDCLRRDPYGAHKSIIGDQGYPALLNFVRSIAMEHKLHLMVLPVWKNEADKWKAFAGLLLSDIVESDHRHPYNPQDPIGKFEMPFGFRSACVCVRNGNKYIRGGCLVRADKVDSHNNTAFRSMLKGYNKDVRTRAKDMHLDFQSIMDWLNDHTEALEIWKEQLKKRERR